MLKIDNEKLILVGSKGTIDLNVDDDEIILKFSMLFEGECEGFGASLSARKFGYTRQRYYQLLQKLQNEGIEALKSKKTGPQTNYKRTDEVIRQMIRHRFLDPDASPAVIAQKMTQCGYPISIRSIERIISQFGLQKKTSYVSSRPSTS